MKFMTWNIKNGGVLERKNPSLDNIQKFAPHPTKFSDHSYLCVETV